MKLPYLPSAKIAMSFLSSSWCVSPSSALRINEIGSNTYSANVSRIMATSAGLKMSTTTQTYKKLGSGPRNSWRGENAALKYAYSAPD